MLTLMILTLVGLSVFFPGNALPQEDNIQAAGVLFATPSENYAVVPYTQYEDTEEREQFI